MEAASDENIRNEENEPSQANTDTPIKKSTETPSQNTQSPRSILKKTPPTKPTKGKNVYLVKNSYPRNDKPKLYKLVNFENLLKDSVDILLLPSIAKKVFNEDGKIINSINEISEKQTLYISCGEKFGLGAPSPQKRPASKLSDKTAQDSINSSVVNDNVNQSPIVPKTGASSISSSPSRKQQPQSPKKSKKENEIASFQRTLILSTLTSDISMREASASVFASMTEEQRERLKKHDYIEALHDEIQQTEFIQHLFDKSICPTLGVSPINEELNHYAIEILNGLNVDEIKFVIDGPRQSGKTSFLFILAKQVSRKIQLSDQSGKFLFFPINFEYLTQEITNPKNILKIFLSTILNGLKYSNYRFLPYLPALKQFFASIVNVNIPQLPSILNNVDFIDANKLIDIGRQISNALHKNEIDSLKNYIKLLIQIPQMFASVFGFEAPFYIYDSFDYCDINISASPEYFSSSIHSINLAAYLSSGLSGGHYLVSLQDEERFFECFACQDAALINIQNAVKEPPEYPNVSIFKPKLHFTIQDCHGYPGYIIHYMKLVDSIRKYGEHTARKSNYAAIRTSADISRMIQIKRDLKIFYADLIQIEQTFLKDNEIYQGCHYTEDFLSKIDDEFIIINDFLHEVNEEEEDKNEIKT